MTGALEQQQKQAKDGGYLFRSNMALVYYVGRWVGVAAAAADGGSGVGCKTT